MIVISVILYLSIIFFSQDLKKTEKAEFYMDKCLTIYNIIEKKDTFDIKTVSAFLLDNPNDNSIIEYIEWRNELLHELIEYYPEEMLFFFSTITETQKNSIYDEFRIPIHDAFNYDMIKIRINSVKGYDTIKKELNEIFNNVEHTLHK